MINELEGSSCGLRYYPGIYLEELRKLMANFTQDNCCPD
jgi:hypothetical protein